MPYGETADVSKESSDNIHFFPHSPCSAASGSNKIRFGLFAFTIEV